MPRRYGSDEVRKVLESFGWQFRRQRGSHMTFDKPGEINHVTVPRHRRELDRRTFGQILRQAGIRRAEFDRRANDVL